MESQESKHRLIERLLRGDPWLVKKAQFATPVEGQPERLDQVISIKDEYCLAGFDVPTKVLRALQQTGIDTSSKPPKLTNKVWYSADKEFLGNSRSQRIIVASFIIQAYGGLHSDPCTKCLKTADKASGHLERYMECRTLPGLFNGICGNCKRDNHAELCSHGEVVAAQQQRAMQREAPPKPRQTRNSMRASEA